MNRPGARIVVASLIVVAVLLPLHFFTERPRPTAFSTALVLLLFFIPPALAAAKLRSRQGSLFRQTLEYLGFGSLLGLLVGLVGGLVKGLLHWATGEPLPLPLGLWSTVALFFALATGLAYGVMLSLVRGMVALLLSPSPEAISSLFAGLPPSTGQSGLLYNLIPGLGHFALGHPARGRPFLLAAVTSGLSGLVVGIGALILLVEGGVPTLPLLVLGAALLLFPLMLAFASMLDLLFLRHS